MCLAAEISAGLQKKRAPKSFLCVPARKQLPAKVSVTEGRGSVGGESDVGVSPRWSATR